MTKEERDKLGLTKPLTYRYTLASGDIFTKGDSGNTPFLRALARVGIWTLGEPNDNEKYFTPESIMAIKNSVSKNIPTNFKYPIYISDFEAPLKYVERTLISSGGPIYKEGTNEIIGQKDPVYDENVKREAETKLTPAGVQLGLLGAGQQEPLPQEQQDDEQPVNSEESREEQVSEEEREENTNTASSVELLNALRGLEVKNGKTVKIKGAVAILDIVNDPKINDDGSIDVQGNVGINPPNKKNKANLFENGKLLIRFGNVTGDFNAKGLKSTLTSLAGFPKSVGGTLDISESDITSLNGCPQEVQRFICQNNKKLTSLAGGPKKIKGYTDAQKSSKITIYDVSGCSLTTLDGNGITDFGPGGFNCSNNQLTTLSGLTVVATSGVTEFNCSKNKLTSLVGAPKPIKDAKTGKPGNYDISNNPDITTLPAVFADFEVDDFKANGLKLTSLSFAPKKVFGNFECKGNKDVKITNQSIGKDRFKVGGGFEEDASNRVVAIDGSLITDGGTWQDKTYTIATVYKKPADALDASNFVPSTGNTVPPQYKGNVLSALVKVNNTFWYQEASLISVAAFWDQIKPYTPTEIGKERIESGAEPGTYVPSGSKNLGSGQASLTKGTSGKGGIQYKFAEGGFPDENWLNWSMFEDTTTGWANGQPTGATIINGKNYGAKTAHRKSTPVMYWLKGDPHPKPAKSSDIFVAKISSKPHAQDPASQASFINNITVCVPAASMPYPNMGTRNKSEGAAIAQVRSGTGAISYFAIGSTGSSYDAMKKIIETQGKTIMFYQHADPGGSFWFQSGGEIHPKKKNRGYPIGIKW